ncbi:hypothetical protein [Planktothrix mougeotii]|uniref:Uncharacterized protein n=1 Tax=Planktothrix mougeotii LEGE 06226 TaxID=1828728 RepID=A0ABR9UD25_9CYAN|nr:hypothetical protein [Planktothrix mougeotii]MBE9144360.1 hypothetical protein [Planktothrix mougeotii LEGE 06226]
MEPFVTAAVALGMVVGTKALEKTGEKLGETLFEESKQLLTELKQESPITVTAIKQASNQPVNYSEAISALQSAAQNNPKLRQKLEILAQLGQKNPYIQEVVTEFKSNPTMNLET